jgi:hypothetical protein
MVLESRVPRRVGTPENFEGLLNEELHNLYYSTSIIIMVEWRRMGWVGHVARNEETLSAYKILVGKTKGKGSLGRPKKILRNFLVTAELVASREGPSSTELVSKILHIAHRWCSRVSYDYPEKMLLLPQPASTD